MKPSGGGGGMGGREDGGRGRVGILPLSARMDHSLAPKHLPHRR